MRPVVEILGPWLKNKGDGLLLASIVQRYGASARLAASSALGLKSLPPEPVLERIKWPARPRDVIGAIASGSWSAAAWMCRSTLAATALPRAVLAPRGLVAGRQVDVVLDCSGFAYGDGWSAHRVHERAAHFQRVKRQGAAIVMLPQALGPFTDPVMREACRRLFSHCDLIYARDARSLAHLAELGFGGAGVGLAPDISHMVTPPKPADASEWSRRVCIVPNMRMVDRTSRQTSEAYVGFLLRAMDITAECGLEPVLMMFEDNDVALCRELQARSPLRPRLFDEDALVSKGLIGASYAVIGSRYHALVCGLSQGVPSLGTSWSHKYEMLFAEYGCEHLLASPEAGSEPLAAKLRELLAPEQRGNLSAKLARSARRHREAVADMWRRTDDVVDRTRRPTTPLRARPVRGPRPAQGPAAPTAIAAPPS